MSERPPGVDARTWHFGEFYGVAEPEHPDRPLLLVHGNCQAEAMRVVVDTSTDAVRTIRMPAVHELTATDVPHLQRVLEQCAVVVAQPVRDGYRDLPLGTAEVLAAATRARPVMVPVVRDSRLYPFQALVRVESAGEPPVVPYHDLRTLAVAAGGGTPAPSETELRAGIRAVGVAALTELRRREAEHDTLVVSDLLESAGAGASHTLNHPGNAVLVGLVQRVLDALGDGAVAQDPGRVLLRSVIAPLDPLVLDVLGLDPTETRPGWLVAGEPVPDEVVRSEQLAWYAEHPAVVAAGLERHRDALAALGL